jgi:allantoinase
MDVLIRHGQVVTPYGVKPLDVAIENDTIVELAPSIRGDARETIDASGLHVFPGVIDAHVHFNEPGRTDWEGWATGSAALAAGGGTCCFEMPLNAHPPTLDGKSFDLKRVAAEASSVTDFALWGGLTPDNLDTMDELADRGVIGFKAFMSNSGIDDFARADDETLRRGMKVAARRGLIVAVHAESEAITSRLTADIRSRGGKSWRHYLDTRPIEAETEAIDCALALALENQCRLHIVHISSPAGLATVCSSRSMTVPVMPRGTEHERDAHATNRLVTAETCPHYLLLNAEDLIRQGAAAKCAPPLRSQRDVDTLRADLLAGKIDVIASDHSPAPASMKTGDDAFKIWGGIAGVQSTLPALLTIGVPPEQAAKLTATNVAERFGVAKKGRVAVGFDADLALVDVGATYTLTREMLLDRHKLSPYVGRQFTGLVKRTICRGNIVFLEGRIVGAHRGRLITPGVSR